VHGKADHLDVGVVGGDLPGRVDAVQVGHRDVHDHDVGRQFLGHSHRRAPVRRLADHRKALFAFQQSPQALSYDLVIVRYEDSF